jgi:predicted Zn-dependent protease
LAGCQSVPLTGREQFNVVTSAEENRLGRRSFEHLKKAWAQDPAATVSAQRVGQKIARASGLTGMAWEFVVFKNSDPQAFCLPGGKVGLTSELLAIAQTEACLAAAISHVVAHMAAHHGGERLPMALQQVTGRRLIDARQLQDSAQWQSVAAITYGFSGENADPLRYSLGQELEARRIASHYLTAAGYAPEANEQLWRSLAAKRTPAGPLFNFQFLHAMPAEMRDTSSPSQVPVNPNLPPSQ